VNNAEDNYPSHGMEDDWRTYYNMESPQNTEAPLFVRDEHVINDVNGDGNGNGNGDGNGNGNGRRTASTTVRPPEDYLRISGKLFKVHTNKQKRVLRLNRIKRQF
jgi:hypothetical protein